MSLLLLTFCIIANIVLFIVSKKLTKSIAETIVQQYDISENDIINKNYNAFDNEKYNSIKDTLFLALPIIIYYTPYVTTLITIILCVKHL